MNNLAITEGIMRDDVENELAELDKNIEESLAALNQRQRDFVRFRVVDGISQEEACLKAGYSATTARQGKIVSANVGVQRALKYLARRHTLSSGWSPEWKRRQLEGALDRAKLEENHARSATAQDKVLRTILELDGDIKGQNTGGPAINITISTGIDAPGIVIDNDDIVDNP